MERSSLTVFNMPPYNPFLYLNCMKNKTKKKNIFSFSVLRISVNIMIRSRLLYFLVTFFYWFLLDSTLFWFSQTNTWKLQFQHHLNPQQLKQQQQQGKQFHKEINTMLLKMMTQYLHVW